MNAVIPTESWLHKFNDWAPFIGIMLTFLGGVVTSVVFVTKQQTKKIKGIVKELTDEHNKNGGAHVAVAAALRQERGELFREIAEQINDQNVTLARIEERGAAVDEQVIAIAEAHNASVSGTNPLGCRLIPIKVRIKDPSYTGPFRRKTDPK